MNYLSRLFDVCVLGFLMALALGQLLFVKACIAGGIVTGVVQDPSGAMVRNVLLL